MKKAIVLLSGGIDSLTCLVMAQASGFDCYALTFNYGQKHVAEINAAKKQAEAYKLKEHRIINIDLRQFGHSALTADKITVPAYTPDLKIKSTYVPARNTIFLAYALAYAEVCRATAIFVGFNLADYHSFPDARPEYLAAFTQMAHLATKQGIEQDNISIQAPLLQLDKTQIIQCGNKLNIDYSESVTCYAANSAGQACGICDSCQIRKRAFETAKLPDPTKYIDEMLRYNNQ